MELKFLNSTKGLVLSLLFLSTLLYSLHYVIFRDFHHIAIYLLGDVAFLPIDIIIVTLIIERVLSDREKSARMEKLNMVIGAFFSEVGYHLLQFFSRGDPSLHKIRSELIMTGEWSEKDFLDTRRTLKNYEYHVDIERVSPEELRALLLQKRDFMLRLIENPVLLEHETFTEILMAVFHLTEEMILREDFKCLPGSDCQHLEGDMKRAYTLLIYEWLDYMKYLKYNYPYLFSLAMRTNPFNKDASAIVK